METSAILNGNNNGLDLDDGDESLDLSENEIEAGGNGDGMVDELIPKTSATHIDMRVKRRAKRPSQYAFKEATAAATATVSNGNPTAANLPTIRLLKNSRKSRNGFGRGLPKKGGAGGKGTWGRPGSELLAEADNENPGDPNYDSDSQENYVLAALRPELSEEEVQKNVEPLLLEYLEHGETGEVAMSLAELNFGDRKSQIPLIAITLAMDRKPSHRELTSVLISDLYLQVLSQIDIARGFSSLLKNLPDIVLDTPEAPVILGNFMARAVADDCLPPKFLAEYKGEIECEYARAAIERAEVLLSMKHGLVRLDNVWGVGGGTRPVKYLIKKMVLLLKEFLSSGDAVEAMRCLKELEVPHFHHELVYEAVVMVLEDMGERTSDLVCKLLKFLYAAVVVTPEQMKWGFERVFGAMPEISIDVPAAYVVLERFLGKCLLGGFVTDEIVRKMPSRGRKRFVSEGDGGLIKEVSPLHIL